jgi:hypothetical protein
MSGTTLIETTASGKLRATAKLAAEVAKLRKSGDTLPKVIAKLDKKTGAKTIHLVSPIFWKLDAEDLGPIENTPAAILAARRSGERREVVAARAGISVAEVRKVETSRNRKPVYTGKGTKKHLATA